MLNTKSVKCVYHCCRVAIATAILFAFSLSGVFANEKDTPKPTTKQLQKNATVAKKSASQNAKQSNVKNKPKKNKNKKPPAKVSPKPNRLTPESFSNDNPYEAGELDFNTGNPIDKIISEHFKRVGTTPAGRCSDVVFIRRITLDIAGRIPTTEEVKAFVADKSIDKRAKLVDRLLESDDFVNYWTMRLADILRIKSEFPINLWPNAAQAYTRFVRKSLEDKIGWDEMARRMLTSSGSNFRVGEVNFMRAMQARNADSIANCVALTFMGMRYDKFPETKKRALTSFFERVGYKSTKEWKEEIVFDNPALRAPFVADLPDGTKVCLSADEVPRRAFAKWLTKKGNPYFAKAFANRIWSWIFGTPIVSPADDMFSSNPQTSPKLLTALATAFEESNFDIRSLCRMIATSATYSQSFIPRDTDANRAKKNFAVYPVRRLDAEIIIDSICKITGTTEIYWSATPEPYTTLPDYEYSMRLHDGSVSSPFLELFGKAARDTGTSTERVSEASPSQKLHMLNSSHIMNKISNTPKGRSFFMMQRMECLNALYYEILSRPPTRDEAKIAAKYLPQGKRDDWSAKIDIMWATLNSEEFINKH